MPIHVRVERGLDVGAVHALADGPNGLGRSHENAITLRDDKASAEHARIDVDAAGSILTDLDSTNGTLLNESPLTRPMRLRPGDTIQIGNTVLVYDEGEAEDEKRTTRVQIVVEDDDTRPMMPVAWTPQGATEMLPLNTSNLEGDELKRVLELLDAHTKVAKLVSGPSTESEILNCVLDVLFDILPAERGAVVFIPEPGAPPDIRAVKFRQVEGPARWVISRTISNDVVRGGRGVLIRDASADERYRGGESIVQQRIRSAMCVPVATTRQIFGVVYLHTSSPTQKFTEWDLELLKAIGVELALAIENFRLNQKNLQAERLAAIGQAIAGLSHYIKNILQSMDAARYLVQAAIEDGDRNDLAEAWDALDGNTELISELVLNMLSYSRQAAPVYERLQPNLLVTQLAELVSARAQEHGSHIELDLDENMPEVDLDRGAIHRALLNLLTNAIDAEGDGPVLLSTRWEPQTQQMHFRVTDSGPGIPASQWQVIFEAFYTTKGSRGTGLGLAVSRKLVEDLGGTIEVESEPGHGATFTIALPVQPGGGGEEPQ